MPRDTVTRRLAHEPFGHRPTTLLVRVRRYRCDHWRWTWRQDVTLVLDLRDGGLADGTAVRQWAASAGACRGERCIDAGSGYVNLVNLNRGRPSIQQWATAAVDLNQEFVLVPAG